MLTRGTVYYYLRDFLDNVLHSYKISLVLLIVPLDLYEYVVCKNFLITFFSYVKVRLLNSVVVTRM